MIPTEQKALWLYELRLNGFIVLPGFVPIELVHAMYEQILPLFRGELARLRAGDESALRGPNRLSFDLRPYIERLKGPLDDDRFRRNPVIEELVTAVLGRWRYGVTKVECPMRNSVAMVWHPDTVSVEEPVRPQRMTFNIPLVDVDAANGPMEVIPGSHRMGHHDARRHIGSLPRIHSTTLLLRRGDAVLRDGNLLHRGTPNLTDEPRLLLDQTYRRLEETNDLATK